MGYGVYTDTHAMYRTVGHVHLDTFVYSVLGDFPDAGLNLIECADGRWFVEVDGGGGDTRFDHMHGVSCPNVGPYVEPLFYADKTSAMMFALECIKTAYPELANLDLQKFAVAYFDEDGDQ